MQKMVAVKTELYLAPGVNTYEIIIPGGQMVKYFRIAVIAGLIILLFSACSFQGLTGKQDEDKLSIRGTVIKLYKNNELVTLFVEGDKEADTEYDKASVTIDKKTVIQDSAKNRLAADDIKEGFKVEIIFTGPVRESYPVQATAMKVVVLSKGDTALKLVPLQRTDFLSYLW
jgi:beta-N-acetylhexosaminidase